MASFCIIGGLSFTTTFPRPSNLLSNFVCTKKIKSFSIACDATKNAGTNQLHLNGNFFPIKFLMDYEDKVGKIKQSLIKANGEEEDPIERLMFVDAIQRLGVAHHFQEEIHTILETHYTKNGDTLRGCYSLHDAALSFRLFRQRGYLVSAEVFNKFKGKDIEGLLELYEATHLSFEGEESVLDEFSSQLLLANITRHPYHKTIPRLAQDNVFKRHLQTTKTWGKTLTQLAEMDLVAAQSIHRQELQHVYQWWDTLGLTQELKLARNQPLKWYTWSMAILIHDITLSWQRVQLTKSTSFIYLIDDIFDLYGTPQDLAIFTQAVHEYDPTALAISYTVTWDYAAMEMLPEYMKKCYKALLDTTNEISHIIFEKHGHNPIHFLKQTWESLCNAFLVEAEWFGSKELPRAEEYLCNGKVSSGVHVVLVHLFFLLGLGVGGAIQLHDTSTLISSVAAILRLWDDLGSAKDEDQNGKDGSYIECYMNDHPGSTLTEARERVIKMIKNEWKVLNKECFNMNNSPLESSFQEASLNLARMVSLMYTYDDNQRLPILDEYINFMLVNQPPMANAMETR